MQITPIRNYEYFTKFRITSRTMNSTKTFITEETLEVYRGQ